MKGGWTTILLQLQCNWTSRAGL